jgi:hypothetical protein
MMWEMKPDRRRDAAHAIVRYGPDLTVLLERLGNDERVSSPRNRFALRLLARGRSIAIDPLPESTPFVASLDERVTRSLVMRFMLRGSNEEMLREAWPGPEAPLSLLISAANLAGSAPRPRLPFLK